MLQGKGSREQGNLVVKEAVAAMMHKWNSAFRSGLHLKSYPVSAVKNVHSALVVVLRCYTM